MQCYIVKNTLLHTAFFCNFVRFFLIMEIMFMILLCKILELLPRYCKLEIPYSEFLSYLVGMDENFVASYHVLVTIPESYKPKSNHLFLNTVMAIWKLWSWYWILEHSGDDNENQPIKKKKKGLLKDIFGGIDLDSTEGKKLITAKSKNAGAVKLVSLTMVLMRLCGHTQ